MNTESIYELQDRLRAACIAGTNLLSEDFRLRRAFEAFKPLEAASPVFAKVGELTEKLLSPDCQNQQCALLDTITLVDAVICTLGTVDVKGEVETAGRKCRQLHCRCALFHIEGIAGSVDNIRQRALWICV